MYWVERDSGILDVPEVMMPFEDVLSTHCVGALKNTCDMSL